MGWLEWRPGLACVLLALLSGCTAGSSDTPAGSAQAVAAAQDSSIATTVGSIAGVVLDDEERPLPDVEVYLRDDDARRALSDASGAFRLAEVAVGEHPIIATKFAFVSAESRVLVEANAVADLVIRLAPVAQPPLPFTESFLGRTFISCAAKVGALTFSTLQVCEPDPNHQTLFDFPVTGAHGLVAVVLELDWDPTLPGTSDQLRNEFQKNPNCDDLGTCDPDIRYGRNDGPSPNKLAFGSFAEPFRDGVALEGPTTLTQFVFVPRDNEPLYVFAVQQAVDNYVTAFYNSEPSADYTLVPTTGG